MTHFFHKYARSPRAAVLLLTGIAAVLFGWGFTRDPTHPYYTAAVRSMSGSWHDFLYGSFDPSGFITTDKLPGAFWVQALSARLFGFHPWSVLLPQVAAATAGVPLLYATVRRWAGARAGLVAAAAYALTPVTVALARTNIPDALMVFFLLLAAHAFWLWADGGRRAAWWLAASASWLGVAFNVKMGQALLAVPVFLGVCYLLGQGGRLRRLARATMFGAAVTAVSLSWMVFVTLTPATRRPYIDGSLHDSVWEMVFQYNGFGRLGGQGAGSDPLAGGGVLVGMGGAPGLGRLFGAQTAGQISWLIPAALLGLGIGLAARRRAAPGAAPTSSRPSYVDHERAGWLFWGGWFAAYAAAFCTASGIHSYYTSSLAPPIAAMTGAGVAAALRGRRWQLSAMVLVTGGWAFAASRETPHYQPWLRWTVLAFAVLGVALLAGSRPAVPLRPAAGLAVAATLFAAPAVWTASVLAQRPDAMGTIAAAAGPPQSMFGKRGLDGVSNAEIEKGLRAFGRGPDPAVTRYLAAHQGADRYAAVVDGSMSAASYLAKGVKVLPMGGFTGDAPAPTPAGLAALFGDGSVRYAVIGGMRMSANKRPDARDEWVKGHCRAVPGLGGRSDGSSGTEPMAPVLYDCGAVVRQTASEKSSAAE